MRLGGIGSAIDVLLDAARTSSATVVHAMLEGPLDGKPSGTARVWRSMGPATRDWTPESEPTRVISALHAPGVLVIPRHHGWSRPRTPN